MACLVAARMAAVRNFFSSSLFFGRENASIRTLNAAVSAYNTPTVVQFGAVLLLAGVLSAPWQTYTGLGLVLGLSGLVMVFYLIIVLRRIRRVPHYQTTLEDWTWYLLLPLSASILLIVAAFMLPKTPSLTLYIVGLAMMLLLLVGIRNAWDMVTFLAVERAHSENKNVEVREVGKTRRLKNKASK